jgi:NADH-quinone oxidoreductase subunit G
MEKINLKINGKAVVAQAGDTIMQAAARVGIKIPKLCYTEMRSTGVNIKPVTCRICEVEVSGGKVMAACVAPVKEGLEVHTNSKLAIEARRSRIEALLSDHPQDCLACSRNMDCELQTLAAEMGVRKLSSAGAKPIYEIDDCNPSIVRDQNKCVLCRRCDAVCTTVQTVGALAVVGKGADASIGTVSGAPLGQTGCVFCGQCAAVCPTAALAVKDDTAKAWAVLQDPNKYIVAQIAPSVRAGLGQLFNMSAEQEVSGKLNAALRLIGFNRVLNTNFTADLTIMEEGAEFIKRLTKGGTLPMITSCCPAWVKFAEHNYPDLLEHLSTAKSPQQMFGALTKTFLAEKLGIEPTKMVGISIMPCTAKKFEAQRDEMKGDVDIVLTTQEIAKMLKEACIDLNDLEVEPFDAIMGDESGAGAIFGVTGGVMQAALRTVYEVVTGERLENLLFEDIMGFEGSVIKEATVDVKGTPVKVAVAHQLRNAKKLLDDIRDGKSDYHFIEVMACPAGCVNGGGQPRNESSVEVIAKRSEVLYNVDKNAAVRRSHENAEVKRLYDEYLGEPYYGENAYKLLHTSYSEKPLG